MGGHDDFGDWHGGAGYRDERGGRDGRGGYAPADRYEPEGDPRVPAPRGGEGRYGDIAAGPGDWDRRPERYPAGPTSPGYGPADPGGYGTDRGFPPAGEPPRGDFGAPELGLRGPRSGEPLPPPPPPVEPLRQRTEMVDAAAMRRSVADTDGVYRSKRPALAIAFGVLAGVGELLMMRPLLAGMFKTTAGVALAPLLAMIAFPMLALGLYALTTGATTAVQFQGPRVWLRTPLVYLVIGVALLIAAGTAA